MNDVVVKSPHHSERLDYYFCKPLNVWFALEGSMVHWTPVMVERKEMGDFDGTG